MSGDIFRYRPVKKHRWKKVEWKGVAYTDACCNRYVKPGEAQVQYTEVDNYDARWIFECRCKKGFGCTVNKNYLKTAHLRGGVYPYAED